ncbi:MAG: SDR family oxidoreductase [Myxococcota bacterium]
MSVFREDLLRGQVALVTGGATGIGQEIARTLGSHGARVCICSRKADNLEKAANELEAAGIECLWIPCDIRHPEQVQQVLDAVLERWGRLDVLVNNAAGNFPAPLSRISPNGFKTIVDIDLLGTYNCSKLAYEAWLRDHGGNIVNISAPFEGKGAALQAHVAAAKAGVDSLTRTCAVEWGRHGIRVNGVMPGPIADTEGMARFDAAIPDSAGGSSVPLGRDGTRSEMANVVLFLVSDAASFVSGQIFSVDGAATVDQLGMAPRLADLEAAWPKR